MAVFLGGAALLAVGTVVRLDLPRATRPPRPAVDRGPVLPVARNGFAQVEQAVNRAFPPERGNVALSPLGEATEHENPPKPDVLEVLASSDALLAALHQARSTPGFQLRPGRPTMTERLPRFGGIGAAGSLAALRFRTRAMRGDVAGGVPALVDALWLGRRLAAIPGAGPLTALVGNAIERRAIGAAHRAADPLFKAPEPVLAKLAEALSVLAPFEVDVAAVLAAERDMLMNELRSPLGGVLRDLGLAGVLSGFFLRPALPGLALTLDAWSEAIVDRDRDRIEAMEALCRPPADEPGPWIARLLHPLNATSLLISDLSISSSPADAFLMAETRFRGLRTEVAIARYRQAHGRLPARLADLVPEWLPAVPGDPFKPGKPLFWEKGKLWSVGPDGLDQGGEPLPATKHITSWPTGDVRLIPATYKP